MKSRQSRSKPALVVGTWLVTPDKFLTPHQVAILRTSVEGARQGAQAASDRRGVRNAVIVKLLLGSGLRVSELCALRVDDLYLRDGHADVLVRRGNGGKGRIVAVSERLAAYLRDYLGAESHGS